MATSASEFAGSPDSPIQHFTYGTIVEVEEDRHHEFKAVQLAKCPRNAISHYAHEYVNSFLNSLEGGAIFFGIEDDGRVLGIPLDRHERDSIRLMIDSQINRFSPQVDASLYETSFVEVTADPPLAPARYVVIITVMPGTAPVYFTRLDRLNAYMRRDGGNVRMDRDTVLQRLVQGRGRLRSLSITCTIKPDAPDPSTPSTPHTIPVIKDPLFVGREAELEAAERFIGTNPRLAVICLHGLPLVGKSALARRIISRAVDLGQYPDHHVFVDLKGVTVRHASLHRCLLAVVLSIDPSTPVGDRTDVQVLTNIYRNLVRARRTILFFENVGGVRQEELSTLIPDTLDPGARSLVVVTSRRRLDIATPAPVLTMVVDPLAPSDCVILIDALLHKSPLGPDVKARLADRCLRLPMAIRLACTHLTRFLNGGGVSLGRAVDAFLAIPGSESLSLFVPGLEDVIAALAPPAQSALSAALMLGPTFDVRALGHVTELGQLPLADAVAGLEERGLLKVDTVSRRLSLTFGLASFTSALPLPSLPDIPAAVARIVGYYSQLYTGLDVSIHEARAVVSDKLLPLAEAFVPSQIDCSVLVLSLLDELGSMAMLMKQPEKRLALLYHMFDYEVGNAEQALALAEKHGHLRPTMSLLLVLTKYEERLGRETREMVGRLLAVVGNR